MHKNMSFKLKMQANVILLLFLILNACNQNSPATSENNANEKKFYNGIGSGPIHHVDVQAGIDSMMVLEGEKIFQAKCISCHLTTEEKRIGPGLKDVTSRRRPEWIMNQIMNPLEMTKNDSLARELLSIYLTQMTPMDVNEKEAREILEYLRTL